MDWYQRETFLIQILNTMARKTGDKQWKVSEVKEVCETLQTEKSPIRDSNPKVQMLSQRLGRESRSVRRVARAVRSGNHRLLKTRIGKRQLSQFVIKENKPTSQIKTLFDNVKKTFERTQYVTMEQHTEQLSAVMKDMRKDAEAMVKLAHSWGYNTAVNDMRKCVESMKNFDFESVDEKTATKTAKILFKNAR